MSPRVRHRSPKGEGSGERSLAERLAAIAGPAHVTAAPGLDVDGVPAPLVVAPGTLEEAAAVLAAAREAGAAVVPWGGGTQQRVGTPPARLDLVLKTERLDRVVEWEPADLTAGLQAGLTLAAVQARLAEHGQQLPIDAPVAARATLGGLVATNACGPRRWQYGSWRDLIIGMHMALADGTVIKSGGRVVKNVQGYDLAKLFTGSLGTLGVIGQVNVKLVPLPAARRLIVVRGSLEAAAKFLQDVAASTARVAAVDLLDEDTACACGLGDGGAAGLVLVEGSRALADDHAGRLAVMARPHGLRVDALEGAALEPVWQAWVDLDRTDDLGPGEALLTVSALPAEVPAVMDAVSRATEPRHAGAARRWARAGNGVVYARLRAPAAAAAAAIPAVQAALLDHWPATTLVVGDPSVEQAARPWGKEPEGLAVMRALKARFDPAGVLQPGRFVEGI